MKDIEYYYNIFYYFFYNGAIKSGTFIAKYNPFSILIYLYYKLPSVKQKWIKKGIKNPYKHHINIRVNKFIRNKQFSPGTIYGGFFSLSVLGFLFLSIYHLIRNLLFPGYEDNFIYSMTICFAIAWTINNKLTLNAGQGEKYITEFNRKKGWWRIRWASITLLSPFFVIWLAISTSNQGAIGQYILSLSGHYQYGERTTPKEINELICKNRFNNPNIIWNCDKYDNK